MDAKSLATLELAKILAQLSKFTAFSASTALALALTPTTELREAHLYSQRDLATALQVTVDEVAAWEAGSADPTPTQWAQLARHFHVPVDQLTARGPVVDLSWSPRLRAAFARA